MGAMAAEFMEVFKSKYNDHDNLTVALLSERPRGNMNDVDD